MTPEEAESIAQWKIIIHEPDAVDIVPQTSGVSEFDRMNLERQENKILRAQSNIVDSKYDPALKYCVLGSSAEVERVWSMAGYVLTDARSAMSPLVFELIMTDVVTANRHRLSETPAAKKRSAFEMERLKKMHDEVDDWEVVFPPDAAMV